MSPDIHAAFGHYTPSAFIHVLIRFSQRCSHTWLGRQVVQLVRYFAVPWMSLPVDVAVGPIRMRCYLQDNASEKKFAFMPWRFDGLERQFMVESLPADGVFVDIGANVGIYSLTAATHLGSRGRVIAIEPNPPAMARLRFNVAATLEGRSDCPKVDALEIGVGDAQGSVDLHLNPRNLGASSMARPAAPAAGNEPARVPIRIICKPLLDILAEQSVARIDVLKVDIEGAEDVALAPFLAAAPASLLPFVLIIENSEHLWKRDLVGALKAKGYTVQMRTRLNAIYRRVGTTAHVAGAAAS